MAKHDNKILQDPAIAPTSKKPLLLVIIGVSLLLLVFAVVFLMDSSDEAAKRDNSTIKVERPQRKALASGGDQAGIISEFFSEDVRKKEEMQTSGVIEAAAKPEPPALREDVRVVTVHMPTGNAAERETARAAAIKEQENHELKRMRFAALQLAVHAPLSVRTNQAASTGAGSGAGGTGASKLDVEALTSHLRQNLQTASGGASSVAPRASGEWTLSGERTPGFRYELKTGAVIPGVLITGINSDLGGSITAQVGEDVFDSTTGRHLLIPSGARLFGTYANAVAYGQSGLFVVWQRITFPDGSSLTLGEDGMGGSRQSGQSGFSDQVNNHYFKIFGSAIMMSLITAAASYTLDDDSSGTSETANINSAATNALAQQLGQASLAILQKNLSISPTLEIRPGYQFIITVTKDIVFDRPYYSMARR